MTSRRDWLLEKTRASAETVSLDDYTRAAVYALLDQDLLFPAAQLINSARIYSEGADMPSIPSDTPDGVVLKQIHQALCRLLRYEAMYERQRQIQDISAHTFQWLFEDDGEDPRDLTSLPSWLEKGSGLYLISGKEGSGKSTLIKHVFDDERTTQLLNTWASSGSKPLVTAAFFFWRSGARLEKSEEGLLRSLLFSVLTQKPEFSPTVLPKQWATLCESYLVKSGSADGLGLWELEDLRAAFERLCKLPLKLFFLIDGLDEYQHDSGNSAGVTERIIRAVNDSQDVKALVSSRPLDEHSELGLSPELNLHEKNRDDIREYVLARLENFPEFETAARSDAINYTRIVNYVSTKADGSFLWAKLAVETIGRQFSRGQDLYKILQSLESIKTPLMHELYRKLWSNMATVHQAEASKILRIVLAWRNLASSRSNFGQSIRLIDLTLALSSPERTIVMDIIPWDEAMLRALCRKVADCFTTAWPGFITIDKDIDIISSPIQFCHRSVLEFLESDDTSQTLLEASESREQEAALCPYTAHLNAAVHHLKILPKLGDTDLLPLLWVFVTASLSAANKIDSTESANSPTYRLLLEQLDSTMKHHHQRRMYEGPDYKRRYLESKIQDQNRIVEWRDGGRDHRRLAKMHWSNFHFEPKFSHPRDWEDSFLSLAVQFGLKTYVKEVLEKGDKAQRIKKGRPLLNYALAPSTIAPIRLITHEMVEILLDHGSKVNEKFEHKTCWENALIWQDKNYVRVSAQTSRGSADEERELGEIRAKIFLLLLNRGADPSVSVVTPEGRISSAFHILKSSFEQSASAETWGALQSHFPDVPSTSAPRER